MDPWGGYYFDGNDYWTNEKVIDWWAKFEDIVTYMIDRYQDEFQLPTNPHNRLWDFGEGVKEMHFFGPIKPLPENYKAALDFYQNDIKNYLEWYMEYNNGSYIQLDEFEYDWSRKDKLDADLKVFNPKPRDLIAEYKKSQDKI